MRTLNPFVFIVQMLQLFPDLLFSVSGGNAILTTDTWTAQAFNAPTLHAPDILLFVAVESVLRHYKATSAIDLQAAPPRITTTTKAPAPNNAGCGHSGTQAMRTLNPFVFIVQVIETLQKRIDDLENRSRRSNLIVYGLAEQEGETSESLEQAVNEDRALRPSTSTSEEPAVFIDPVEFVARAALDQPTDEGGDVTVAETTASAPPKTEGLRDG
ncbi:hypothetical protein HPB51_018366 [Rhipicephalus microplus]|uniref:Uncharacterized protein n=1 Tax=Rhipicephalus microplus TaxID=6941 RepID=A0A9J6EU61_RHIMP|nr:hypothetical protein HPB51_018366 [Rhipicephalus microplus]